VLLVREAPADGKVGNVLSCVSDGVEAMRFMRCEGPYADAERPDLVLLDLNLPRKSGAEVLADIKGDPALATIPVIVLTTSEAEEDVLRSYRMHAHAFITKPVDFDRFKEIVHEIDCFFIGIVKLPPR
jgi:CheY-like chemotaxis protein